MDKSRAVPPGLQPNQDLVSDWLAASSKPAKATSPSPSSANGTDSSVGLSADKPKNDDVVRRLPARKRSVYRFGSVQGASSLKKQGASRDNIKSLRISPTVNVIEDEVEQNRKQQGQMSVRKSMFARKSTADDRQPPDVESPTSPADATCASSSDSYYSWVVRLKADGACSSPDASNAPLTTLADNQLADDSLESTSAPEQASPREQAGERGGVQFQLGASSARSPDADAHTAAASAGGRSQLNRLAALQLHVKQQESSLGSGSLSPVAGLSRPEHSLSSSPRFDASPRFVLGAQASLGTPTQSGASPRGGGNTAKATDKSARRDPSIQSRLHQLRDHVAAQETNVSPSTTASNAGRGFASATSQEPIAGSVGGSPLRSHTALATPSLKANERAVDTMADRSPVQDAVQADASGSALASKLAALQVAVSQQEVVLESDAESPVAAALNGSGPAPRLKPSHPAAGLAARGPVDSEASPRARNAQFGTSQPQQQSTSASNKRMEAYDEIGMSLMSNERPSAPPPDAAPGKSFASRLSALQHAVSEQEISLGSSAHVHAAHVGPEIEEPFDLGSGRAHSQLHSPPHAGHPPVKRTAGASHAEKLAALQGLASRDLSELPTTSRAASLGPRLAALQDRVSQQEVELTDSADPWGPFPSLRAPSAERTAPASGAANPDAQQAALAADAFPSMQAKLAALHERVSQQETELTEGAALQGLAGLDVVDVAAEQRARVGAALGPNMHEELVSADAKPDVQARLRALQEHVSQQEVQLHDFSGGLDA